MFKEVCNLRTTHSPVLQYFVISGLFTLLKGGRWSQLEVTMLVVMKKQIYLVLLKVTP